MKNAVVPESEAILIVSQSDMASSLFDQCDSIFPEVFATSRMIALMELAAARAMLPILQPHQVSVGVLVTVKHISATPNGTTVKALATFKGMEGKLYKFFVEAFDDGGKIGEGDHSRAIVDKSRLIDGAVSKQENKKFDSKPLHKE
jgi:predicted thioesterase